MVKRVFEPGGRSSLGKEEVGCTVGWVEISKSIFFNLLQMEMDVIHKNKTYLLKKIISKVHRLCLKWPNMNFFLPLSDKKNCHKI